jgi:hypothetical protein
MMNKFKIGPFKSVIKKIKIGSFRATWVVRHRWEEGAKKGILGNYEANNIRTNWQLGIWTKRSKVVGSVKRGSNTKETTKQTFSGDNLVNNYMIGLNLIVLKTWVDFTFRPTFGN